MRRVVAFVGLLVCLALWARAGLPKVLPDLVEVGTVGDLPPAAETIRVHVLADGTVFVNGRERDFPGLRSDLRALAVPAHPSARPPASPTNVLLYADKTLPWQATGWLLTICAEAKINRVWHAVRPEGGGETGAMALFLPIDRGFHGDGMEPPEEIGFDVQITDKSPPVQPAELYAALKKMVASLPAEKRKNVSVIIKAGSAMPSGFVLRVVDMAIRAGIARIDLYGVTIPPRDADLKQLVTQLRAKRKGDRLPGIRVDNLMLEPGADGPSTVPAVVRVKGYAGLGPKPKESELPDVEEEEEEIEEEPQEPEEEITEEPIEEEMEEQAEEEIPEEPIETEEEVAEQPIDEMKDDGLSDTPFQGPSRNSKVGLGSGPRPRRWSSNPRPTAPRVESALAWLVKQQDPKDGRWRSGAEGKYDTAVTGLALLAFLNARHTDRGGPHAKTVRLGLRFLTVSQQHEGEYGPGLFGSPARPDSLFGHAVATVALCEAWWRTRNPRYKKPAQEGLNYIANARNPYLGWGQAPRDGKTNTSTTVWCLMALKAGKFGGLDVDPDAFEGARMWIAKATDTGTLDVGGAGPGFPPATPDALLAAAAAGRFFLYETPENSEILRGTLDRIAERLPSKDADPAYIYFGSIVSHRRGGEHWTKWNAALKGFVEKQHGDGEHAGSWDPAGKWSAEGGRVWATALMTLCAQVHYGYDGVFLK